MNHRRLHHRYLRLLGDDETVDSSEVEVDSTDNEVDTSDDDSASTNPTWGTGEESPPSSCFPPFVDHNE
eukprot:117346-Heterocapsa_arctica.AAC.1